MIRIEDMQDQSSSESASARIQGHRRRPGNRSDLSSSSKRKRAARVARTAANNTSFSSDPLKLEGVIEDRDDVASVLMTPEVREAKDVFSHAIKSFCLVCNCSF